MPITFQRADEDVLDLIEGVKADYHPNLNIYDVKIGVIMAFGPINDETGEKTGPAIKGYAGASAAACVKVVPLKDRLTKGYDAEMFLDGDEWPNLLEKEQIAILDHECTHLMPTGHTDDLGRPKIKLRKEDFIAWGFWSVIKKHGHAALEHKALKRLSDQHGQLLLDMGIPLGRDESTITIQTPGTRPVTVTATKFAEIAKDVAKKRRDHKPLLIIPEQGSMWVRISDPEQRQVPVTAIDGNVIHFGDGAFIDLGDLHMIYKKIPA